MIRAYGIAILVLAAAFAGCGSSHITADGGGDGDDGGVVGDGGGVVCEGTVCAGGQTCCLGCEPGTGYCSPETSCPPIDCFYWTSCEDALVGGGNSGQPCSFSDGCGAAGGCCDRRVRCVGGVLDVMEACLPDCLPPDGCESTADCGAEAYCDFPAGTCGGIGVCTPRPELCTDDCPGVCGCDGEMHCNACDAATRGVDVGPPGHCGTTTTCAAQDAHGAGACDAIVGIFWNGTACVFESGCSCTGADCGAGYVSYAACEDAHRDCFEDCRATGCPDGQTCEPCWATYACLPPGAVC